MPLANEQTPQAPSDLGEQASSTPGDQEQSGGKPIRLRVLGLILVTQIVLVSWVSDSEIARSIYLICYSLMMPTVLYLLFARLAQRWLRLTTQEILLGYIVLTATIPIVGFGGLRFLLPGMGYIRYFAESQPHWSKYLPFLANLPVLHDPRAVHDFFHGGRSVPWQAWLLPIGFWSLYLLSLSLIWLGLAAILHRIWIHQERLTFPITVLPIQLTDPRDDLFRRPLFWIGAAIPIILQSLLVFHDWYPFVPAVQLKAFDVKPLLFTSPPWNAISNLYVGFYPMAIGLAYIVPSNVSFSCWFFWLLTRLSYVVGTVFGLDAAGAGGARFPYPEEQAAGAWIAMSALILWGERLRWAGLMRSASGADRRAMRRLGGLAVLCMLLCAGMMTCVGLPPLVSLGIVGVYVAYVICGARVRAEAGGQWTFAPLVWTPFKMMNSLSSVPPKPGQALLAGGLFDLVHVDIRAQSFPYLMEGLKIAETVGIRWRTVLLWVGVGTVTALAVGWWSGLSDFYSVGAATSKSNYYALVKVQIGMTQMDSLPGNRPGWDQAGVMGLLAGGAITLLLSFLQMRVEGFPFHPIGYVLCNTLTMGGFFVPFFLAWLVKVLVQRYGGSKLYRVSLPFFVGLILGDIAIQTFWTLVGRLLDVPIYQFLS